MHFIGRDAPSDDSVQSNAFIEDLFKVFNGSKYDLHVVHFGVCR